MSATVPQQAPTAPDSRRWWALAVLVMAQFVAILDAAIVNVALPSIQARCWSLISDSGGSRRPSRRGG